VPAEIEPVIPGGWIAGPAGGVMLSVRFMGPGRTGIVSGKINMTAGPVPHALQMPLFTAGYPSVRYRIPSGSMNSGLFLFQSL